MLELPRKILTLAVVAASTFASAQARAQSSTLYFPASPLIHPFGQHVLHEVGWDRYLMYFSANSAVRGGKPVGDAFTPVDPATLNYQCPLAGGAPNPWADRIWLTWSFGDGLTSTGPLGWHYPDNYGNTPPFLILGIGAQGTYTGVGERALIGVELPRFGGQFTAFVHTTGCGLVMEPRRGSISPSVPRKRPG